MAVNLSGILKLAPEGEALEAVKALRERVVKQLGLIGVPDDKLHVTMLHQKLTGPLKGKALPNFESPLTLGDVFTVERPGKRSAFVTVNEQDQLHNYIKNLGVEPEAKRRYHISLGNLTGNPGDSVGHLEDLPIMEGASRLDLNNILTKQSMYKFASVAYNKGILAAARDFAFSF
jgi:hypothetical protein